MKKISGLLELVEIQSTPASIFPVLMGLFYAIYRYNAFNIVNTILFFIGAVWFHMAVNVNDNYQDLIHANKSNVKEFTNGTNDPIGKHHLDKSNVKKLLIFMLLVFVVIGIILVIRTGIPLLIMGIICFLIGYFYAAGPRPISTTPFGELFSGIAMGLMIFMIGVYVNVFTLVKVDWNFIYPIIFSSLLPICYIANMMLANNICDIDEDLKLHRKTICFYIGKINSLHLYTFLNILGFVGIVISVILRYLPVLTLFTLLAIPVVYKNNKKFYKRQDKDLDFGMSVQNLLLTTALQTLTMGIGILI